MNLTDWRPGGRGTDSRMPDDPHGDGGSTTARVTMAENQIAHVTMAENLMALVPGRKTQSNESH